MQKCWGGSGASLVRGVHGSSWTKKSRKPVSQEEVGESIETGKRIYIGLVACLDFRLSMVILTLKLWVIRKLGAGWMPSLLADPLCKTNTFSCMHTQLIRIPRPTHPIFVICISNKGFHENIWGNRWYGNRWFVLEQSIEHWTKQNALHVNAWAKMATEVM